MFDMNQYPDALIPQSEYANKIALETLKKFYLSRRIDGTVEDATFEEDGQRILKRSVIEDEFDAQLSMNLLGGGFRLEDTAFRQVREAAAEWHSPLKVDKMQYGECVTRVAPCFAVVLDASTLYRTISYERVFDKVADADAMRTSLRQPPLTDAAAPKRVAGIEAQSSLLHSPTYTNYWHVQLQIKPSPLDAPLNNVSTKTKSAWRRALWTLCIGALFDENPPKVDFDEGCVEPLNENVYK
jgi:hypothetical protein